MIMNTIYDIICIYTVKSDQNDLNVGIRIAFLYYTGP